jgi:hypothetical protein
MKIKAENKNMKVTSGEYFTVADMAKMLDIPIETIKTRIKNKSIKPLTRDALYAAGDFEKIKNVKIGRPSKKRPVKKSIEKKPKIKT